MGRADGVPSAPLASSVPVLPLPPSTMSRAFVNEDAGGPPEPTYTLPDPDSDAYDEAAARALLEGAHQGHTTSAERATGYRWGEPHLVPHVEAILEEAEAHDELRTAQLARRFLREARRRAGGD